jgi:hypothetical protein
MEDGFHCVATGMADPADDLFPTKFLPIVGSSLNRSANTRCSRRSSGASQIASPGWRTAAR